MRGEGKARGSETHGGRKSRSASTETLGKNRVPPLLRPKNGA
jgi:hypothetical protein